MNKGFYILISCLCCFAFSSQAQWTATNGPYGGNITDIEIDASNNAYAIVSQNLYKSTNNGSTWQKLATVDPPTLYINDLIIANNKFYAVYFSSFYTSTDGLTWTRPATTFPFSTARKVLKFGPDGFIAVYGDDGIFVSKDEGVTWVQALSDRVNDSGYERTVATSNGDLYTTSRKTATNPYYAAVQIKKLPYPGLNGTFDPANWQTQSQVSSLKSGTITTSTSSNTVTGVGTSFTTDLKVGSVLQTVDANSQYIGQVASITNNTTLVLNANASIGLSGTAFYADPYQYAAHLMAFGSNVYYFGNNDISITQDGGATWASIKGNITASCFWGFGGVNANGAVYYYNGCSNEIYTLINPTPTSNTWTITPSTTFLNFGTNIMCWSFFSTSNLLVGTNSAGVFKSTDTGANYTLSTTGINGGNFNDIAVANSTNTLIVTSNANGYFSSTDGGATWTLNSTGTYVNHVLKLSNGNILLYGSKVFRSVDNGASFSSDANYYYDAKILEAANGDLYGFRGTSIAKSTDHGITWFNLTITGLPAPATFSFNQASVDETNSATPNFIFQIYNQNTSQQELYKLVGTTATKITSPYSNYFNNIFFQNGKFYVAQYSAYYYTSDLGANWTTVGFSGNFVFPIKNSSYSGIAVSRNGSLYTSQDGGGAWNNTPLPTAYPNAYITDIDVDGTGNYYASVQGAPVVKNTAQLLVDPSTLPPYINFNWQPLNGPFGGRITKIDGSADGNTLFAIAGNLGSQSRLWKYSGSSWAQVNPVSATGAVWDVEVDASDNVYALTFTNPQKIYKSTDLGATWNALASGGLPGTGSSIRRISVLADGSIVAYGTNGTKGAIYKSIDGGATFVSKFTSSVNFPLGGDGGTNSRKPAISSSGVIAIFGVPSEGMLVSTDNGDTWTAKLPPPSVLDPTGGFVGSYMFDSDDNLLMQTIVNSSITPWNVDIYKSTDNGTTWTALNTPNVPTLDGSSNYSKRIVALGTGEYLMNIQSRFDCYRSTDKGVTWNNIGNVGDVFIWAYTSGTTSYVIGSSDAGVLKTTDGGLTFNTFSQGIPHPNSNNITFLNNNKDLIIGATRPFHSSDYGQTINLTSLEPGAQYLQVGDSVIAYGNNRRMLKSNDAGKTWTEFGADNLYYTFLTKDVTGNGFYGSDGISLLYSTDLLSWTNIVLSGLPASYYLDNMVIDQNGVIYAVVVDNNTQIADVYKIVFGSATKISAAIGTQNPANIIYLNNKIYLYDGNGAIYTSTDGETWAQISAPSGISLVETNGYLFIPGGGAVLWLSRNGGASWQSVGDTPPSSGLVPTFRNVAINPFDGYAYATLSNSVAKRSGNMVIPNDNTKPIVVTYSPAVNGTGVNLKPTLNLTFDEVTNAVAGKIVRIFDLASQAVPIETLDMATATQDGKTWSIPTTATLSFNKTYFVIMDAGAVTDIFGNQFIGVSSNLTWRFTTQSPPTVAALLPANNVVNVGLTASFKITFSEPTHGVSGKNVKLYAVAAPATPVATLDAATGVSSGDDLTFTFAAGTLQYNTQYFIQADANAFMTVDGGTFSAVSLNTDWTFTTETSPDTQAPSITHTPANITQGSGNGTINATISDNVGINTVEIYYRPITSIDAFVSQTLTSTNNNFSATVPEATYGPLGLEYYFTASDAAGNSSRGPTTGNYYSYISYASSTSLPLVASAQLGIGGGVGDWRIISIPHKLGNANIATVLAVLGGNDKSKWRLITYKDQTSWSEYPGNFTAFVQGKGYFVNIKSLPTNSSTGIVLPGAVTSNNNKDTQFTFTLSPGWNQIGNPYTFPMEWNEVLTANGNPQGIATTLKTFDGNYIDVGNGGKLEVFQGAFVLNSGTGPVTITVPVVGKYAGGRIASPEPPQVPGGDLANDNWVAPISLKVGTVENSFGGIGMNLNALTGVDKYDDFNPPHLIEYAEMGFAHPEHFLKTSTRDVVPTQQEYTWSFEVSTNVDEVATLSWNNSVFGNGSKDLVLFDEALQKLIDMRVSNQYQFNPGESSRFRVYFGENAISKIEPSKIFLGKAYPNPSRSSVTIPFTLPDTSPAHQVALEVYDLMGRKITTLVDGLLSPGFYSQQWEPATDLNRGLYIYRLQVTNTGKTESLNGKIILEK